MLFDKIQKENNNCLQVKGDVTDPRDVSELYKRTPCKIWENRCSHKQRWGM